MEILDFHLKDFPPTNETDRLLMSRDIKMAEYTDHYRPYEERMSAVAQGNMILEQLLEQNPKDDRRFDWRYTLVRSLIYDEAKPHFTNILYRGGTAGDRMHLGEITRRALKIINTLQDQLEDQYKKLDRNG